VEIVLKLLDWSLPPALGARLASFVFHGFDVHAGISRHGAKSEGSRQMA
jgi:hypothetical protein